MQFVRNEVNLGFIGACNHGAALARGEIVAVPQQRHDRDAGLARCHPGGVPGAPGCGARRREAHLPGWQIAGGGRHRLAGRIGMELGPRRRPGQAGVQLPARSRLLFWRVPRRPAAHCSAKSAASMPAIPLRITKTWTSRSRCVRRVAGFITSRSPPSFISRARRPARTRSAGVKRHQVVNQATFANKWGSTLALAPRERHPSRTGA